VHQPEKLAEKLGTKSAVIVCYDRGTMKSIIEAATKIFEILEVSLD
jgi:ribosome-binding protein aMBF1 (putative translation factor)